MSRWRRWPGCRSPSSTTGWHTTTSGSSWPRCPSCSPDEAHWMTDPTGYPAQTYTGQTRSMPRHQYPAPPPPPPPPPGPPVAREPEPVEEEPSVARSSLVMALARLLLLEIFFYGIGAILGAVLNTRGHFAAPMWAPILNNFVVMATCALFIAMPGPKTLTPHSITTNQVLVLGGGTTLGIVVQALALVPALRKVGFRWRARFVYPNPPLRAAAPPAPRMPVPR